MKIIVEQEYTSVACNRTPEIADWNNEGIICFGAKNAVVIYDTNYKSKDPLTVLSHHKSQVNSVKWLHNSCTELVSCSADKTAAIWTLDDGWKVTSTLTGHGDGVTCVHGIFDGEDLIVFTASIDSSVRVWERKGGTVSLKQSICLQSGLCLTLHAHMLSGKPVLFCALDDHKIHVFAGEEYHRVHTLVGHEDWVRGMDVLDVEDNTILLASASQDTYIRLWRIQEHVDQPTTGIKVEEKVFHAHGKPWSVKLEAVLSGHEGWVYGVQWHPYSYENGVKKPVYRLLSSSLDKTLIIWEPESSPAGGEGEGVWTEKVRVGEVGGNGLGFYGSRFGPGGTQFMGHGYNGSFHIWNFRKETGQWEPAVVAGGHYSAVEDVAWEPHRGRYLVSVSADQTSRLHAPWVKQDGSSEWHEIARPQVHGYDLASLALITSTTYASAAEEKVIRVFTAPHNLITNFKNIVGDELVKRWSGPEGASVPSLGLSNKAVFSGEDKPDSSDDNDGYFVPVDMTEPPKEETLVQHTLWPETQKLYGHGYEVFALAASPDGALLASACKATTLEHAAVLIWETSTWHQIQKLTSHTLTVTQMAFSPDSSRLLSVSRDRRWSLFCRRQGSNLFDMVASTDKTNGVHSRIIWCCAWAHDGSVFATGSRDGKLCVWTKKEMKSQSSLGMYGLLGEALSLPNTSITAIAFAPLKVSGERIVSIGFESGVIRIYSFGDAWRLLRELDNSAAHHLAVRRVCFRPLREGGDVLLASCGADNLLRIHRVTIC
ncbi:probable elongator complex protein 2 [Manduca sexta]|uniref:probable elongator complex protein 2 n=1 Tax=Manduca sexta TaxID=7130 RepID=UPI00188E671A|nr:probable elongator complex protein 2 [Manduca sexta]